MAGCSLAGNAWPIIAATKVAAELPVIRGYTDGAMLTRFLILLVAVSALAPAQGLPLAANAAIDGPQTGRDGGLAALRR